MKKTILLLFGVLCCAFIAPNSPLNDQDQINAVLDHWHQAAAAADSKNYFDAMTEDAVFIGTDATENWNKKAFEAFAKPYFDKGKAWDFQRPVSI